MSEGRITYGPQSTDHMEKMIRNSSNTSTNWLMDQVGGPRAVHRLLYRHYDDLFDSLKVVEHIPRDGRTYRNIASAADHGRLLRAIWRDRVPYSRELKRVMNLPGPDRLYYNVPAIPVGTAVYNKTGSTARCCGDMGILVARKRGGGSRAYIVVAIIERATRTQSYTAWIQRRGDVIRQVSGLTYRWLRDEHDLV